tara:strand:+ start:78 stop:341 length:264 start_codon:yes stop_codon:yes gene_type:complete
MVDIALGLGSLVLLVPVNSLVLNLAKRDPQLAMGVPAVSMFINAFITLGYGFWLKPCATNEKLFIGGLLLAIFSSMIVKLNKLLKTR